YRRNFAFTKATSVKIDRRSASTPTLRVAAIIPGARATPVRGAFSLEGSIGVPALRVGEATPCQVRRRRRAAASTPKPTASAPHAWVHTNASPADGATHVDDAHSPSVAHVAPIAARALAGDDGEGSVRAVGAGVPSLAPAAPAVHDAGSYPPSFAAARAAVTM